MITLWMLPLCLIIIAIVLLLCGKCYDEVE